MPFTNIRVSPVEGYGGPPDPAGKLSRVIDFGRDFVRLLEKTIARLRSAALWWALVSTLVFFYPALRNGSEDAGMLYSGDLLGLYVPALLKTHWLLSRGIFAGVDTSVFNGSTDYFLVPNYPILHPLLTVIWLLVPAGKLDFYSAGHWLIVICAFHVFLSTYFSIRLLQRFLQWQTPYAVLAGFGFSFGYSLTMMIEQPQFLLCVSTLPWLCYRILAYAEKRSWWNLYRVPLPMLFAILGGYIPIGVTTIALSLLFVSVILLLKHFHEKDALDFPSGVRLLLPLMAPYAFGSVVLGAYLYSVFRYVGTTISSDRPSLFYSAHQLAQLPHSLLKQLSSSLTVPGPFAEFTFGGSLLLVFIGAMFFLSGRYFGTERRAENRLILFCLALYAAIMLATFGEQSVMSDFVYYFVPQVGGMHIYQRFIPLANFFLMIASALMLKGVNEHRSDTALRWALLLSGGALLIVSNAVAVGRPLARELGLNEYVVVECFLCLIMLMVLRLSRASSVVGFAVAVLLVLPSFDKMYDLSHGDNTLEASRRVNVMALDEPQKAAFVRYLERFRKKEVIKYVDLSQLWKTTEFREPFPKSFAHLVLEQVHLSSYSGFDFRMGTSREYLSQMRMVVKNNTWVLSPAWGTVFAAGADFVILDQGDLANPFGSFLKSRVPADAIYNLPNGLAAVALPASDQVEGALFDNGYVRVAARDASDLRNLALRSPTTQSSTFAGREARLATDGNRDGRLEGGSVSHTGSDPNAWLQVDLGKPFEIHRFELWNVVGYEFRLRDFWLFVSDTPFRNEDTAAQLSKRPDVWARFLPASSLHDTINVVGVRGRYVRLQLGGQQPPTEAYLHLGEFEVWGKEIPSGGGTASGRPNGGGLGSIQDVHFDTNHASMFQLEWNSQIPTQFQYLLYPNPNWKILLNGSSVRHTLQDGLLTIDAPAGKNRIEMRYRNWGVTLAWLEFALYFAGYAGFLLYAARRWLRGRTT